METLRQHADLVSYFEFVHAYAALRIFTKRGPYLLICALKHIIKKVHYVIFCISLFFLLLVLLLGLLYHLHVLLGYSEAVDFLN